ncbi:ArsR/SmtB family transcription factor [Elusimicrobiota bacterium]
MSAGTVSAATAAAAAAQAAKAAAAAAAKMAKKGATEDEIGIIFDATSSYERGRHQIIARKLDAEERIRLLHDLWIEISIPFIRALGDKMRLKIVGVLGRKAEMDVGAITAALKSKPSTVSQQLGRLREVKVVRSRKEAQTVFYALNKFYLGWMADIVVRGLEK